MCIIIYVYQAVCFNDVLKPALHTFEGGNSRSYPIIVDLQVRSNSNRSHCILYVMHAAHVQRYIVDHVLRKHHVEYVTSLFHPELSVMKKPVLFVPYPHAAEDHQSVNALNLVKRDAALMIKDDEAVDKMIPAIIALAKDETRLSTLRTNIAAMAFMDADRKVAEDILKSIRK